MADIFFSYASPDRARAETLKTWFEQAGWSVWIDREIELGLGWEAQIQRELDGARLVVVLWGPAARRSEWVQREALAAHESGRLLQIHATGLPLLPPFDTIQAVRMQSWSGESQHSERVKLVQAVGVRLGEPTRVPELLAVSADESLTTYHPEISEALELAFHYCARQVERVRLQKERGHGTVADFEEVHRSFEAMLALLRTDSRLPDDREGILHRLMEDFLGQLLLLAPDPNVVN